MKFKAGLVLFCIIFLASPLFARRYEITPDTTQVTFQVNYLGLIGVIGRFDNFEGSLNWDEDDKQLDSIIGRVVANSVNSSNKAFDQQLKDPSILNAEKNKYMLLKSLSVEKRNGEFIAKGFLHFHGIGNEIEFPVKIVRTGHKKNPKENYIVFSSKFDINVKRWRVVIDENLYSPTVNISIQGKAVHKPFF